MSGTEVTKDNKNNKTSVGKIPVGTRVYMPENEMFGNVTRNTVLGNNGIVAECDDGVKRVFCGNDLETKIYCKDDGKNLAGEEKVIPTDVSVVGPSVLQSMGLEESTQKQLLQKFMVLDPQVRLEKAKYWEENKDDKKAMSVFLPDLLQLLASDANYIKVKSQKLLSHVDETTRSKMYENLMNNFSVEEREEMMSNFTDCETDRRASQDFIQGMYRKLLDSSSYLSVEFHRSLNDAGIFEQDTVGKIDKMLSEASESEKDEIAEKWRVKKYYRSKSGSKFALGVISRYDEQSKENSDNQ